MNSPEWLKPAVYGAIVGAIFVGVVGFSWGGWVTGGGANKMAQELAHDEVIASLVPVCLDIARSDPNRLGQLATIKAEASYKRRDAVMATGWATVPGSEDPNRDLAQACLAALDVDAI
jgi:alpha/beta superfamily hydrolase